ncbi:hypothetical protein CEG18_18835 [Pseudomonas nitroreducens]|uniref:Uncharacterized protein n=1 Tax=Pseudomonas nitroreducens TaxID=46680 RepID=A0A2D0AD68_PSENT|nr:hypothetical protein CEG18_18835 [Pseudomonas nitroreducens]
MFSAACGPAHKKLNEAKPGRGAQLRSRGLTRRRQACWRSRMRVCAVFMSAKLKAWESNGKHLVKIGRNGRLSGFGESLLSKIRCLSNFS